MNPVPATSEEVLARITPNAVNSGASAAHELYALCDPHAENFRRYLAKMIRCRGRGCAACCHPLVLTTLQEAAAIARYLYRTLKPERRREALEKCLLSTGILHRPEMTRDAYFAAHWPCFFLTDKNDCAIYPVRPHSCRYYYVGNDPAQCAPSPDGKAQPVRILQMRVQGLEPAAIAMLAFREDSCRNGSLPLLVGPLSVQVWWMLTLYFDGKAGVQEQAKAHPECDLLRWHEWSLTLGASGVTYETP